MYGPPQSPRATQGGDHIERPVSRISTRNGYIVQHAPPNRPPSNTNRPPSTSGSRRGSLTRSPFTAPQMAPTVGLGTARVWHPSNPFFNGVVRRQPSRGLQNQGSSSNLRTQRSVRVLRVPSGGQIPLQATEPEYDQMSPHRLAPSASRMHLRPQPSGSFRRVHIQRDPNNVGHANVTQHQQSSAVPIPQTRTSPSGSSTLSEDERVRRATELVQRRMQELAQQQRASPAATARLNAASGATLQQRIDQRLALNMGRAPLAAPTQADRQPDQTTQGARSTSSAGTTAQPNAALSGRGPIINRPAAPPPPLTSNYGQTPGNLASAQHRPQNNQSTSRRTTMEQVGNGNQVPSMAQGVTALTTGGDIRRN